VNPTAAPPRGESARAAESSATAIGSISRAETRAIQRFRPKEVAMRKAAVLSALLLGLVLASCVPSLHPIYTKKDLIFNPALVGVWSEEDKPSTWAFTQSDKESYRLVYTDEKGNPGEFIVHLAKFDDVMFLDLYPEKPKLEKNDYYRFHLLPVHTYLYVKAIEPDLKMAAMNPDWLKSYLADHPDAIKYEVVKDEIVLTAKPKQLQAFVVKHLKTDGAFSEIVTMKRREQGGKKKSDDDG
jgi:hypothetical protein